MCAATLVWFRLDLRLADNPALTAGTLRSGHVLPVFIWAPEEEGDWPPGAASRWWLHQSLSSLDASLRRHGARLILRRGPSLEALRSVIRESGADAVFWNRRYEPALRERDARVEHALLSEGVCVRTFNSALLFEPEQIHSTSGKPFRMFTPFWRSCLASGLASMPAPMPTLENTKSLPSLQLDEFALEPLNDWTKGLRAVWRPGEAGAQSVLSQFLEKALANYPYGRDFAADSGTSRLSPYLHFGEISPRQVWAACAAHRGMASKTFLRQLGWREFAHHLLYHFPHTARAPMRPQFLRFPWRMNPRRLKAWQEGRTGYPIVDAGMRELWATGWMHNRVRMVVGSFLVKDLLMSWLDGARWFWDTLVDADLANNTLGWQWVAGCGADAAPYFRIFNPTIQAKRFDPQCRYVRRWVPEIGTPGYPRAIVNHAQARERALDALAAMKQRRDL